MNIARRAAFVGLLAAAVPTAAAAGIIQDSPVPIASVGTPAVSADDPSVVSQLAVRLIGVIIMARDLNAKLSQIVSGKEKASASTVDGLIAEQTVIKNDLASLRAAVSSQSPEITASVASYAPADITAKLDDLLSQTETIRTQSAADSSQNVASQPALSVSTPTDSRGSSYFYDGDTITFAWSAATPSGVRLIALVPVGGTLGGPITVLSLSGQSIPTDTGQSYAWTIPDSAYSGQYRAYVETGQAGTSDDLSGISSGVVVISQPESAQPSVDSVTLSGGGAVRNPDDTYGVYVGNAVTISITAHDPRNQLVKVMVFSKYGQSQSMPCSGIPVNGSYACTWSPENAGYHTLYVIVQNDQGTYSPYYIINDVMANAANPVSPASRLPKIAAYAPSSGSLMPAATLTPTPTPGYSYQPYYPSPSPTPIYQYPSPTQTAASTPPAAPAIAPTPTYAAVPDPTASLTVEGAASYTYQVGGITHYAWSSSNADSFSSAYTSNNPSQCGSAPWVANNQSGTYSNFVSVAWAGCVWTVTYTARNSQTGKSASAAVTVTVGTPATQTPTPTPSPTPAYGY